MHCTVHSNVHLTSRDHDHHHHRNHTHHRPTSDQPSSSHTNQHYKPSSSPSSSSSSSLACHARFARDLPSPCAVSTVDGFGWRSRGPSVTHGMAWRDVSVAATTATHTHSNTPQRNTQQKTLNKILPQPKAHCSAQYLYCTRCVCCVECVCYLLICVSVCLCVCVLGVSAFVRANARSFSRPVVDDMSAVALSSS